MFFLLINPVDCFLFCRRHSSFVVRRCARGGRKQKYWSFNYYHFLSFFPVFLFLFLFLSYSSSSSCFLIFFFFLFSILVFLLVFLVLDFLLLFFIVLVILVLVILLKEPVFKCEKKKKSMSFLSVFVVPIKVPGESSSLMPFSQRCILRKIRKDLFSRIDSFLVDCCVSVLLDLHNNNRCHDGWFLLLLCRTIFCRGTDQSWKRARPLLYIKQWIKNYHNIDLSTNFQNADIGNGATKSLSILKQQNGPWATITQPSTTTNQTNGKRTSTASF